MSEEKHYVVDMKRIVDALEGAGCRVLELHYDMRGAFTATMDPCQKQIYKVPLAEPAPTPERAYAEAAAILSRAGITSKIRSDSQGDLHLVITPVP
jgi:hypothetical protein